MCLLYSKNILDYDNLIFFINLIKNSIPVGDVETEDYNPSFQNQFFFVAMTPRERVLFQTMQGIFNDSTCFFWQDIDIFGSFMPNLYFKRQSLISERGT